MFKFRPDATDCPSCGKKLKVYVTEPRKQVVTSHLGKFTAHHTLLSCDCQEKKVIFRSQELSGLVPANANFGFDVIEYVGRAVFQRFRTEDETVEELAAMNISISSSAVGCLSKSFVAYLSVLQNDKSDKIKEMMQENGGFIIQLDGTTDAGGTHLITCMDGLSKFVLANVKIPTENADDIASKLLRGVKERFGSPIAAITDLGGAMLGAVRMIFPTILIFICHFHFLRDIGKDLLKKPYYHILNTLKKYGITKKLRYRLKYYSKFIENIETSFEQLKQIENTNTLLDKSQLCAYCYLLILWALEAKNNGNGYGFPFDTPHYNFYNRLCVVYHTLRELKAKPEYKTNKDIKTINFLLNDLQALIDDELIKETAGDFSEKQLVFENLREAMRIAKPLSKKGLNDNGEDMDIKTIEQRTINFREWLINNPIYKAQTAYHKMIEQIDKYWDKLFADPIIVDTPDGKKTIQPQRTNNLLEQFFRAFKRVFRRTTGNNSVAKKLKSMLADTTLIKNLDNLKYMDIILDGKKTLAQAFAQVDYNSVREVYKKAEQEEQKIPAKIKKIIKKEDVPNLFPKLKAG